MLNPSSITWLILAIVFAGLEAATVSLVSIWFVVGSVAALVVSLFGGAIWLQVLIFVILSVILILATKPLTEKWINQKTVQTNADRIVGQKAIVTERIDNDLACGQIRVMGQVWSAKSQDGKPIPENEQVIISEIQGVKAVVALSPAEQK